MTTSSREPGPFPCPSCSTDIFPPSEVEVREFCDQFSTILFVRDTLAGHCKVCDKVLHFNYKPNGEGIGELSVGK